MTGTLELYANAQKDPPRNSGPQGEVMAILAHDLRSPLSAVVSGLDLALEPGTSGNSRNEILIHARRAAETALRLTMDLMDASMLESGRLEVNPDWMDLEAVVATACGMAYREDGPLTPEVRYTVEPEAKRIWADRDRMMQIVRNLVDNAVKSTPPDGLVQVRAKRAGKEIRMDVEDSGIGIPQDDLPLLFDRFWQARRWQRGGAGLGLSIVKALTEAHRGRVLVRSEVDEGSVFSVILPMAPPLPGGKLGRERISPKEGPLMFTGFAPVWKEEE